MEYSIEKKLDLRKFKKIANNEIVKVHDNYVWSKARDRYECIMDIYGNTLYSWNVFDFVVVYLGRGYFKQIAKNILKPFQLYKDGNSLAGIKYVRFDDSTIIGDDLNGLQCLLDDNGAIISKRYNSIHKFSNSIAPVRLITPKYKMKFGFINKIGNEVIEPCFDDASEFHNHYASILLKNKWGVINDKLYIIIEPSIRCDNLTVISHNLLLIKKKKNKFVSDFNNNVIYKFKSNENEKIDFDNEVIYVFNSDTYIYTKLIDKNNNVIDIKNYGISKILENNIIEYKDGKYGVLTNKLKPIDKKYDSIKYTCNNSYIVYINNKYGVIDRQGSKIISYTDYNIKFNKEGYYIVANILFDLNGKDICYLGNDKLIQSKNDLIVMYNKANEYVLFDKLFNKIVSSKNRIYILDNNNIILENRLVDLNEEYLNFGYVYELKVNYKEHKYSQIFKTEEELNNCIKELEDIEEMYLNKITNLKIELNNIQNRITDTEEEEVIKVKKLIKNN